MLDLKQVVDVGANCDDQQLPEAPEQRLVVIGRITTVFGVKGWVKVRSEMNPMENLLKHKNCFLKLASGWQPAVLDQGRIHGKGLVVHIKGVDDRDEARTFAQVNIAVHEEQLPKLEAGDYYWRELIGLQVWTLNQSKNQSQSEDAASQLLGQIESLIETGANDVLVIKACEGSIDKHERLIPYLPDDVVVKIDLVQKKILVDWDANFF